MIGCLRTHVRKQPIIALYFESELVLQFYNLEARTPVFKILVRALRYNRIILAYCYNWFSILELLGDLLQKRPKDTDSIDNVIIVDNIPVVGEDRLPKLQNVIKKIFEKFGKILTDYYPMAEDKKTKG